MYDSIDVHEALIFICDKIYSCPEKYFPKFKDCQNNQHVPPRSLFLKLLRATIIDFTSFSTLVGDYQQVNGISMGGKCSGLIASIYASRVENSIMNKYIRSNDLLLYNRFVDDSILIGTKSSKLKIFSEMNIAKPNFNYTIEHSNNHKLNFLDSTISYSFKFNELQMAHFEKPTKSQVTINYKNSIAPTQHKRNAIISACNRIRNASINSNNIDQGLNKLKNKFKINNFPSHFVKNEIEKFKSQNQPTRDNNFDQVLYVSLDFTSERCNTIHKNIMKIIQTHIPKFKLIISWRCIRLNSLLTPLTKPSRD